MLNVYSYKYNFMGEREDKIEADILIDLLKRAKIGDTHHTSLDNITKGLPKDDRNLAKTLAKDLITIGILHRHPTSHSGIMVSINPKQLKYVINLPKIRETMQDGYTLQRFKKFLDD